MSNRLIHTIALLASATFCVAQSGATKPDPVLKEKGLRSLDKLAARSGELGKEALAMARKGRFEAAEALAREGIETMSPAPFLEDTPKRVLGEVLMIEKRYEEALSVLEPIYKARTLGFELYTDIAICYAKTGRPELGAKALLEDFRRGSPAYYLDEEGLPLSKGPSPTNVIASAMLIRALSDHQRYDPEIIGPLQDVLKLAPRCGAAEFAIGETKYWTLKRPWEEVRGAYLLAHKNGDLLVRKEAERMFRARGENAGG